MVSSVYRWASMATHHSHSRRRGCGSRAPPPPPTVDARHFGLGAEVTLPMVPGFVQNLGLIYACGLASPAPRLSRGSKQTIFPVMKDEDQQKGGENGPCSPRTSRWAGLSSKHPPASFLWRLLRWSGPRSVPVGPGIQGTPPS